MPKVDLFLLNPGGEECSFRGTTRLELMRGEIEGNTLSFSDEGPRNLWPGVSNYVLRLSSSCNAQEPVAFMYFFDSGGGSYPEIISNAQVEWFQQKSQEINPHSRQAKNTHFPKLIHFYYTYSGIKHKN